MSISLSPSLMIISDRVPSASLIDKLVCENPIVIAGEIKVSSLTFVRPFDKHGQSLH